MFHIVSWKSFIMTQRSSEKYWLGWLTDIFAFCVLDTIYILHWRIRFQDHDDVYINIYYVYIYTTICLVHPSPLLTRNRTILIKPPSLSFKTTSFAVTAVDGFWMLRRPWTYCSSCPTSSLWCAADSRKFLRMEPRGCWWCDTVDGSEIR